MPFFSVNSGTVGILISPITSAVRQITLAAATEPDAFTVGQWSLTPIVGGLRINITSLPADNGSPITSIQYRLDGGAWVTMAGTGTGTRDITSLSPVEYDVELRAVNIVGNGAASDIKSATPTVSSTASYLSDTYIDTAAGSTTITRPAGATATHTLIAVVFASTSDPGPATYSPPSGWTAGTGVTAGPFGARWFSAPGDVSALNFTSANPGGIVCFAVDGTLQTGSAFEARDSSVGAGDFTTPSITTATDDLVVSVYIQANDGAGGAIGGTIQAGYTRQELINAAVPRISIVSQELVAAGTSGTISHGADAPFSNRYVLTMAFTG